MITIGDHLSITDVDHKNMDQVDTAAAVLAKYIEDTGDQEGVVEFLQFMVKSGKVSAIFSP